jgi:hypothetical protein
MNDVSKEFMGPEIRYAGAPDTLKALGGKERIVLNFRLNDKAVNKIDIFWNNRTDTLIWDEDNFVMDATPKEFFIEIPDLREGAYSFEVVTHDVNGNKSVVTRAAGKSYGQSYQNSLLSTPMKANVDIDLLEIAWGTPDASALGMEVYYTNKAGEEIVQFYKIPRIVAEFEKETEIADYKAGTNIKYRTCYAPEANAVDTFFTPLTEMTLKSVISYDRTLWTYTVAAGEPTTGDFIPQMMLDGDKTTFWQTGTGKAVTIDMGEVVEIGGYYVQRGPREDLRPKTVLLYISETETFTTQYRETFADTKLKGKRRIPLIDAAKNPITVRGRYLRFSVPATDPTSGTGNGPQIAEFGVYREAE